MVVYAGNEFLEWSAETYKLFDIPFGKSITYEDMLTYVHPDDKDYVNEKWQMATKHGEYAVVYRIISAKLNIKWIETFGDVVFDTDGNFMQALGIVRDITAQKEGEIKKVALTKFLKRSQKIGKLGSWIIKASSTPFFELNEEAQIMFG
ncbi:PAS domain-containing protein [Thalassobellus suaedae]|uniref:histidine kinase n=1 Tax=Thalassobellus suaedae TaxID=3074124 RepID=A0ABY9XX45_9FLAO|nr:PAS domain-containing protein [Flavobacteriaceae bacterium HL-DH14]